MKELLFETSIKDDVGVGFSKQPITDCHIEKDLEVHDDTHVKVIAARGGKGEFAIVSCDHTDIYMRSANNIKTAVSSATGIPVPNIVLLTTHAHSSPDYELDHSKKLARCVAEAAVAAMENAEPVDIAYVSTDAGPGTVVNRRVILPNDYGAISTMKHTEDMREGTRLNCTELVNNFFASLGIDMKDIDWPGNPVYTNGPIDTKLNAVIFRNKAGKITGSLVRFAAHPIIVSRKRMGSYISADYVGYLTGKVEEELGGVALFGNGPCGNLKPLNREYSFEEAERYGCFLAGKILAAAKGVEFESLSTAHLKAKIVPLPVHPDFPKSIAEGEQRLTETKGDLTRVERDEKMDRFERARLMIKLNFRHTFIQSKLRRHRRNDDDIKFLVQGEIPYEVCCVFLNDVSCVVLQSEVFTQIGKEIADRAGLEKLFTLSDEGPYIGYIPTTDEMEKGGYESQENCLAPGADEIIIKAAISLLGPATGTGT